MIMRGLTTLGLVGAVALAPVGEAQAGDAGKVLGGAIIGGAIGYAAGKNAEKQKQQQAAATKRAYNPGIPSTSQGAQTQTALNYFGYNAGVVDGQIGGGTRRAIEAYQASMGYPVNGRDFQPYQFDFLMQAYYWAQNGGQAQTQLAGQPLLMSYRQKVQTGTLYANAPAGAAPVAPVESYAAAPQIAPIGSEPAAAAPGLPVLSAPEPAAPAAPTTEGGLATLFAGGAPAPSLANHCNAVMLQNSNNGGYVTLATMTDPSYALSEQFCLARSHSIQSGETLMQQIPGATAPQIAQTCEAFGAQLRPLVTAAGASPMKDVLSEAQRFAANSGSATADLVATSRVCLSNGYSADDMEEALGSAVLLTALGEPAYGELVGHHLREGFGVSARPDLAMQWYDSTLTALENGAQPVFQPGQAGRPMLLREATLKLRDAAAAPVDASQPAETASAIPTFKVAQ